MTGIPKPLKLEPCPVCARWTCTRCNWVNHRANSRHPQICSKCGSTEGDLVPITHYDRDTHDAHADCFQLEDSVTPVDHLRMIHNESLVGLLRPMIQTHERYRRLTRSIATGSREWNRAVNLANQELLKIEATVRLWTARHPEGS